MEKSLKFPVEPSLKFTQMSEKSRAILHLHPLQKMVQNCWDVINRNRICHSKRKTKSMSFETLKERAEKNSFEIFMWEN